jgi:hypothetical protein
MDSTAAQLPQTPEQRTYFALFLLFLATIFIGVMAFVQHLNDTQFITSDELKRNIQQLESYSAEASLLSQYTTKKVSPRPYTEAYSASLQDATDSITQRLMEHPHRHNLEDKVQNSVELSGELSYQLNRLETEPTAQLNGNHAEFEQLSTQLQSLEQAL